MIIVMVKWIATDGSGKTDRIPIAIDCPSFIEDDAQLRRLEYAEGKLPPNYPVPSLRYKIVYDRGARNTIIGCALGAIDIGLLEYWPNEMECFSR